MPKSKILFEVLPNIRWVFTGTFIFSILLGSFAVQTSFSQSPPYPPSQAITNLTWAPASSIVRKATGSDTWPITWADDDNLYTAFGDGWGFEPKVPSKLSLGFSKVLGDATNFSGINVRSGTGEQTGGGSSGKKASGMLMVDGVLYMWVRNANQNGEHCQLAWSGDYAATWSWNSWTFTEFGYCTFLNFGKNYADSRDGYVYMYSHDDPSAYKPADNMILTRVPKGQITNSSAYEFLKGFDASSNPIWTTDINQRGSVFTHTSASGDPRALRSGISYNAVLGRYLWWQQVYDGSVDTRSSGGFGIYDAPEPWGPWTTVYFTEDWDEGPGETASFPTKWMSSDGKTMYLVFSGDDSFSVRKATLTLGDNIPPNPPTQLKVQ